jgi:hypothetical protein
MSPDAKPVAIVTGASSGIGKATARIFAAAGYRTVLAARSQDKLKDLAREIEEVGGEALVVPTDVGAWDQVQNLIDLTLKAYGQIDVLVNNAGMGRLTWLDQLDPQKGIAAQINVNLLGLIWVTRAVLPHMIERQSGQIINMGSLASFVATPSYSVYAATKFGLRGFSDALRREVSIYNIKVSVLYPGGVESEFASHAGIQRKTGFTTPEALRLTAEDVAQAVLGLTQRPRRNLVLPRLAYLSFWASYLFPGVVDWVMERFYTRPERQP